MRQLPPKDQQKIEKRIDGVRWTDTFRSDDNFVLNPLKLSPQKRFMVLHPYASEWPAHFQAISSLLSQQLGDAILRIEHVGSTSVPGLSAKPIIDIDMVMPSMEQLPILVERLAGIGYHHVGDFGIPEREVFKRNRPSEGHPVLDQIRHHLYACPPNGRELIRHLRFRDFLRKHEWAKLAYQELKEKLAREANQDLKLYVERKETEARPLIESMLALAEQEDL